MVTLIKLTPFQIEHALDNAEDSLEDALMDPDPDPELIEELRERIRVLNDDYEAASRPDFNELVGNLAGQVDLYKSKGRIVARTWPERRNLTTSYAAAYNEAMFSYVSNLYTALGEEDIISWHNLASSGNYTNREAFFKFNLLCASDNEIVPNLIRFTSLYSYSDYLTFSFYTMRDCFLHMKYDTPLDPEDNKIHLWSPATELSSGLEITRNVHYSEIFKAKASSGYFGKLHEFEFFWPYLEPPLPMMFRLTSSNENNVTDGITGIYCIAYWILEEPERKLFANPYSPYIPIKHASYPDVVLKPNPKFPPVPGNLP